MTFKITKMLKPAVYDHPVNNIELIETHISWVILTGDFAYKIKKPVDFGFLDFSTLEKRKYFCEQELRLNRRLAAAIYLEVVAITGSTDEPTLNGNGAVFEYAVKMAQFPQSAQLDNMLAAGELKLEHMDAIARMIASFHQSANIADAATDHGSKKAIYQPIEENFQQISSHLPSERCSDKLAALSRWSKAEFTRQQQAMAQRKADGFVRHCHGDMHLRNMLWLDSKPMAFDCIEFNPALSWIDVISEIAFLIMDLQHRKQQALASRFLNSYLEITGDYAGLAVLPFYLCYRALVRAKVNALRLQQQDLATEEKENIVVEFEGYLELALTYTPQTKAKLIIMRGLSASGKSTISQQLLDATAAIRLRSDVERKRLFNIATTNDAAGNVDAGIYSADASRKTYEKLIYLASMIINAGYSVIVDAAFLNYEQREPFQQLAKKLKTPYIILQTEAPAETLKQRISQRKNDVSDADLAVLEHQLTNWQALHEEETRTAITVDTSEAFDVNRLIKTINER